MKKRTIFPLSLIAACLLVAGASSTLCAQNPTTPTMTTPPATLVAVVDVAKVFQSHHGFKATMESIQQQLKAVDRDFQTKQQELNARMKELTDLKTSSEKYRQLEADLARKTADLQVQVRQTKKEFMQREAVQYHAAYTDILAAVNKVSDKFGIGLVLRFDSTEIDPSNPQSVALGMSATVVVQRNIDITPNVVQELQIALAQHNSNRAPRR